jgi:hypothetical protein
MHFGWEEKKTIKIKSTSLYGRSQIDFLKLQTLMGKKINQLTAHLLSGLTSSFCIFRLLFSCKASAFWKTG